MLYNFVLVDVFNLAYRKSASDDCIKIANQFIDFIEIDIRQRLDPNGAIYLLFDPIPKSDLGLSKAFKYSPRIRNSISSNYKKDREQNPQVLKAVELVRKYYTFKGELYHTCISDELEADDYVEQLTSQLQGNIALITTDEDWMRFLSDRVFVINKGFNNPFTREDYRAKYGIMPTIATVTLKKAIFGDKSDNIESIFSNKKVCIGNTLEDAANIMLDYLAKENIPFKEVEESIKNASFALLFKNKNRNPLEEFEYELISVDQSVGSPYSDLQDNIRIIKSRCDDVNKYITWKPVDQKYNDLMDATLKRVSGIKKPISFGTLKA